MFMKKILFQFVLCVSFVITYCYYALIGYRCFEGQSYSYKFYKFILDPCVKRGPNISN